MCTRKNFCLRPKYTEQIRQWCFYNRRGIKFQTAHQQQIIVITNHECCSARSSHPSRPFHLYSKKKNEFVLYGALNDGDGRPNKC